MIQGSHVQFLGRSITLAMIVESAECTGHPLTSKRHCVSRVVKDSDTGAIQGERCQALWFVKRTRTLIVWYARAEDLGHVIENITDVALRWFFVCPMPLGLDYSCLFLVLKKVHSSISSSGLRVKFYRPILGLVLTDPVYVVHCQNSTIWSYDVKLLLLHKKGSPCSLNPKIM